MKKFIIIIFCLFISIIVYAEEEDDFITSELNKHVELGFKYMEEKSFDNAEKEFLEALNYSRDMLIIYDLLSQCYVQAHNYNKLKEASEQALRISTVKDDKRFMAVFYSNLAFAYWQGEKDYDKAIKFYKLIINKYMDNSFWGNPKDERMKYFVFNYLGCCYFFKNEYQEAIDNIEKSLKYFELFEDKPSSESLKNYYFFSKSYYELKDYESGYKFAEKALSIDPNNNDAKKVLEDCKIQLKK